MYYLDNSRINKNRLVYCELEVDYYSNEAIKNKFTNFQLIATTKMQLKDS